MSAWRASLRELQNLCVYSAPMTATPGLRERKKRRTRESIAAAAHRLFVERGYHATTLPDIAEAADVSTRTIFAYFPSKEDILFSGFAETIDDLAQALAHRPAGVQTLDVVRDFILSGQSTHNSELDAQLYVCITDDPTLRSHLRARIAQIEDYRRAGDRRRPRAAPRRSAHATRGCGVHRGIQPAGRPRRIQVAALHARGARGADRPRHPIPARRRRCAQTGGTGRLTAYPFSTACFSL